MATRDPEKKRAAQQRHRLKKKVAKYGASAANQDLRGRHGNQARGDRNGRYNRGELRSSHGYVLVRVPKDHPLAFGPPGLRGAYAYEHALVMMHALGRPLQGHEVVHHRNGKRDDNRIENLELTTRSDHAREHVSIPGVRDEGGRFNDAPRH